MQGAEGRQVAYQPSLEKAKDSVQEKGETAKGSLFPVPRGQFVPNSLSKIEKLLPVLSDFCFILLFNSSWLSVWGIGEEEQC